MPGECGDIGLRSMEMQMKFINNPYFFSDSVSRSLMASERATRMLSVGLAKMVFAHYYAEILMHSRKFRNKLIARRLVSIILFRSFRVLRTDGPPVH